jgi:LysR family transcriptional activator of nhaA
MQHLNYNHLLYFWTVVREGGVARAASALHLTPQTVSGQLRQLEARVGAPLFERVGRGLVLTETGQLVREYADQIFPLGAELAQRIRSGLPGSPRSLHVGLVDSIPKLIAYRLLEPVLGGETPSVLQCTEGPLESLLADLALHRLDVVLSDQAMPASIGVRAFTHPLGESGISFFAARRRAGALSRGFPDSLDGAPVLLPSERSATRRALDDWFERNGLRPKIVAEVDDSALLKAFGQAGAGAFPAPTAIADEVERMYGARRIGEAEGVHETYLALSAERHLRHPALIRITEAARSRLARSAK